MEGAPDAWPSPPLPSPLGALRPRPAVGWDREDRYAGLLQHFCGPRQGPGPPGGAQLGLGGIHEVGSKISTRGRRFLGAIAMTSFKTDP
jgi:hypothetical protein